MADLRYVVKNNQKKEDSVFASDVVSTYSTQNDILFTLPVASLVISVYAVVLTASGVASSTLDVLIGSTVVANEIPVATVGVGQGTSFVPVYFATGGSVTVVAGATAPDAAGRVKIVVQYLETELTEGTYTL